MEESVVMEKKIGDIVGGEIMGVKLMEIKDLGMKEERIIEND